MVVIAANAPSTHAHRPPSPSPSRFRGKFGGHLHARFSRFPSIETGFLPFAQQTTASTVFDFLLPQFTGHVIPRVFGTQKIKFCTCSVWNLTKKYGSLDRRKFKMVKLKSGSYRISRALRSIIYTFVLYSALTNHQAQTFGKSLKKKTDTSSSNRLYRIQFSVINKKKKQKRPRENIIFPNLAFSLLSIFYLTRCIFALSECSYIDCRS